MKGDLFIHLWVLCLGIRKGQERESTRKGTELSFFGVVDLIAGGIARAKYVAGSVPKPKRIDLQGKLRSERRQILETEKPKRIDSQP